MYALPKVGTTGCSLGLHTCTYARTYGTSHRWRHLRARRVPLVCGTLTRPPRGAARRHVLVPDGASPGQCHLTVACWASADPRGPQTEDS